MMTRMLALLLAAVMVLGLMAGCGNSGSNSETEPKDTAAESTPSVLEEMTEEEILKASQEMMESREKADTYQTYFTTSYSSLNYFSTSYATVREIVSNCVDGLVEHDKYGVYVASLADSWDHNEDYTVWTFHIREGLKWVDHTGAETEYDVTAQDFVDGIRYIADPLNGAYSMRVVRNLISGLYD